MRPFISIFIALGLLLGVACADDEESRAEDYRRDNPYSGFEGDYKTNMELTEVNCSMALGKPILNGRLMVYERDDHLLFDGPFLLDRVLCRENKERLFELKGVSCHGNAVFLHRLQHGRLRFRRSPVDLVRKNDVGKDRAFGEFEFDTTLKHPQVTFRLINEHGKIMEEHVVVLSIITISLKARNL